MTIKLFKFMKFRLIGLSLFLLFNSYMCSENQVIYSEPEQFKIWGPGLYPHIIVLPARYFFIQLRGNHSISRTGDFQNLLQVTIEGTNKHDKKCRIWTNILDRKDNSLIVRYKIYEECSYININVKYKNNHVGDSPYSIQESVYPEECVCPQNNLQEILDSWSCDDVPAQINVDFSSFETINWDDLRPKIIKQFNKPHSVSLCHYIIKDNQIHRKCYGKYVGFNMFSDSVLLSLARKVKLPDLELFINLGDWPLSVKDMPDKYPIFSWCGSTETNDIVMPTYEITEAALENMGRVMLDMLSVQGNTRGTWDTREPKLFWRGRDSNKFRLELITLSRKYPELINASLTNFFFYRDEEEIYGPKSEHISFFKFFDYKYQLAIDGTVAPYRMPFLLGGGSLVFKPHSKYYEYFYNDLEPYTHYIPVKADLSDLVEKVRWALDHDEEAKSIALNGQNFANEHLLPKNIFCYYLHLLHELSRVTTSEVRVLEGMERIEQKKSVPCNCLLSEKGKNKDEL